jgi:LmbE family N-acetylglucosaminyl deacetylase
LRDYLKINKKIGIILIVLVIFGLYFFWPSPNSVIYDNPSIPNVILSSNDRILIMAPHPDDETVGTGGLIQKALEQGIPVHVVFLTDGDFNEWSYVLYEKLPMIIPSQAIHLGEIRHNEAVNATKVLGLSESNLTFLGYPDYGTSDILYYHWGSSPAYESIISRKNSVPYTNSLNPGSPYKGESIMKDIETVINEFKPTKIFVSHPDDHHPDHRAFYVFTIVSLWDIEKEIDIFPYLVHYRNWPLPYGYYPSDPQPVPSYDDQIVWNELPISQINEQTKFLALQKHVTQFESNKKYLESFIRINEIYGNFDNIPLLTDNQVDISLDKNQIGESPPLEYNESQKDKFVRIEAQSAGIENEKLALHYILSKPLSEQIEFSVYVFGYKKNKEFSEMPKINLRIDLNGYFAYDQKKTIPKDGIEVQKTSNEITVKIPLKDLDNPDKIIFSATTSTGLRSLDLMPWRIVIIENK